MENHEYKLNLSLSPISKEEALDIVKKMHYSNTLPSITKETLGVFIDEDLEGVITLGYGTRPKHTIKRLFPSLDTQDYFEIGRMCINDEFKTNTESQMLSNTMKYIKKNHKQCKLLFTWADGLQGKIGTVYQASNFLYGGFSKTDCYVKDGVQIHPRGIKRWLHPNDPRKSVRPTAEEKIKYGIEHIQGKQFRYVYFVCGKSEKKRLIEESPFEWGINYPTLDDCVFKRWVSPRHWEVCEKPVIFSDDSQKLFKNMGVKGQLTLDKWC